MALRMWVMGEVMLREGGEKEGGGRGVRERQMRKRKEKKQIDGKK